ncbi:MAG: C-terminal binding protein [Spirochaetales bacterium]|jgi:D-3-phosphoglycerate dehydrogenase|nr:C-terminal binding protein [Spirochaetales bacterium]
MAKFKVLMTDTIFPDVAIERRVVSELDADFVFAGSKDAQTLKKEGADADAVLVVFAQLTREVIEAWSKCRIIARAGIGVNNIDIEAATERGIKVTNVPDYCFDEVASHAMALALSCLRRTVLYAKSVKSGVWDMNLGRPIARICGLTFGLFGFGHIAQAVALRAKAFGMKIVAYDPYLPDSVFSSAGVQRAADWDAFLAEVDVLSLHAPLTESTQGIINAKALSRMKKSAIIINTARGPLINEKDLREALEKGVIAQAGLDVLESEPPAAGGIQTLENAIVTPHAAFYSDEAELELREKTARQIVLELTTGEPAYWFNRPKK